MTLSVKRQLASLEQAVDDAAARRKGQVQARLRRVLSPEDRRWLERLRSHDIADDDWPDASEAARRALEALSPSERVALGVDPDTVFGGLERQGYGRQDLEGGPGWVLDAWDEWAAGERDGT